MLDGSYLGDMDVALTEADAEHVLTLRDLIQRHIDSTGESRRALGDRCGVAHQTLGYWWNGSIKSFPEPETMLAFANATRTPIETVLLATARTIGLPVHGVPDLAAMLPPGTDSLSARERDAVLAVIRALVDARRPSSRPREGERVGPPDLSDPNIQGLRLDETTPSLRVVEPTKGPEET